MRRQDRAEGGAKLNPALMGILDCFWISVINGGQNQLGGGKDLFGLQVTDHYQRNPQYETQRQGLEQRPWRNAVTGCFPWLTQLRSLYNPGPFDWGWYQQQRAEPTLISNLKMSHRPI